MAIENVRSSTADSPKGDAKAASPEKTAVDSGKRKARDPGGTDSPAPRSERIRTVPPREPLDAMEDYGDDISRQERAEEAIRQHFRDLAAKAQEQNVIDRKV